MATDRQPHEEQYANWHFYRSVLLITELPIYLVKGQEFDILQVCFVSAIPAPFGLIGDGPSGFVSDTLLQRTKSLTIARNTSIVLGLLMSSSIMCKYDSSQWLVASCMSLPSSAKDAVTWIAQ